MIIIAWRGLDPDPQKENEFKLVFLLSHTAVYFVSSIVQADGF